MEELNLSKSVIIFLSDLHLRESKLQTLNEINLCGLGIIFQLCMYIYCKHSVELDRFSIWAVHETASRVF